MTNAIKAALLSGLAFPGVGQIMLKHRARGTVLAAVVVAGLVVVMFMFTQRLLPVAQELANSGRMFDIGTLWRRAHDIIASPTSAAEKYGWATIAGGWLLGVIDAYLLGRRADRRGKRK